MSLKNTLKENYDMKDELMDPEYVSGESSSNVKVKEYFIDTALSVSTSLSDFAFKEQLKYQVLIEKFYKFKINLSFLWKW